jgi:hypothetical protein
VTRDALRIDAAIAVVIAAIILIASPGTAIDAILALILLAVWAVVALVGRRRARRSPLLRSRSRSRWR